MKYRVAKKVVRRWASGLGRYTDNRFGSVIRAHHKLESYYGRRGVDVSRDGSLQLRGLPYRGLPGLPKLSKETK